MTCCASCRPHPRGALSRSLARLVLSTCFVSQHRPAQLARSVLQSLQRHRSRARLVDELGQELGNPLWAAARAEDHRTWAPFGFLGHLPGAAVPPGCGSIGVVAKPARPSLRN